MDTSNIQQMFYSSGNPGDDDPYIPSIENIEQEEYMQQTAEAPIIDYNRLGNIEELNKKIANKKTSSTEVNATINLSILSRFMLPENQIKENDIPWTWNSLISDIAYLFNANQSKEDKVDHEK